MTGIAHIVFFKLKDRSENAARRLVAACGEYLNDHPGTVYYSAGTRNPDLKRDVNDVDFDVALHVVFESRAAHDAYQVHARHQQFILENQETWAAVRVFDSDITADSVPAEQHS